MEEYKTEFKRWCAENGYTARRVSEDVGISISAVQSYMQGRRYPTRRIMKKMEEVYGVSMRDVFPL